MAPAAAACAPLAFMTFWRYLIMSSGSLSAWAAAPSSASAPSVSNLGMDNLVIRDLLEIIVTVVTARSHHRCAGLTDSSGSLFPSMPSSRIAAGVFCAPGDPEQAQRRQGRGPLQHGITLSAYGSKGCQGDARLCAQGQERVSIVGCER